MTTTALVTFGFGWYSKILEQTRQYLQDYASRWNLEYFEPIEIPNPEQRPESWLKIIALSQALQTWDQALWIDCDVVILNNRENILDEIPQDPNIWQAMVRHTTHRGIALGEVPNCGVWFVRRPMQSVLQDIWALDHNVHQAWWEQAALHQLMGYKQLGGEMVFPVQRVEDTELFRHTYFLSGKWNDVNFSDLDAQPNFMHLSGELDRARRLQDLEYWISRSGQLHEHNE